MKIKTPGTPPKPRKQEMINAWWIGAKVECKNCHAVMVLEASDAPSHLVNFALKCPTRGCVAYIQIRPELCDRTGKVG